MAKILAETVRSLDITGNLSPFFITDQPVLVKMPNEDAPFVLVFSTEEKLKEAMKYLLPPRSDYKIKHIDDGVEFCTSIFEAGVRVMRDPYIVDGWKTHWTEVMPGDIAQRN